MSRLSGLTTAFTKIFPADSDNRATLKSNSTQDATGKHSAQAISHLTQRFTQSQALTAEVAAPQRIPAKLNDKVEIDFSKDFPNKSRAEITQQDVLTAMHRKLAERAGLSAEATERYLKEWQPPSDARMLDGKDATTLLSDEDFAKIKDSGTMTMTADEQNIDSLQNYQAEDLINKHRDQSSWLRWEEDGPWFGKDSYPLNEAELGRDLAGQDEGLVQKVLGKLNPQDAQQVSAEMMKNLSDEKLAEFAQTDKGKAVLETLKTNAPEQSERIEKAKTEATKQPDKIEEVEDFKLPDGLVKVTPELLRKINPSLSEERAKELVPYMNKALSEANMKTKVGEAMFLAQMLHEMGSRNDLNEIGGKKKYEGKVYDYFFYMYDKDSPNANRRRIAVDWLGNTEAGDGEKFHGRGFVQLTGRVNYRRAGEYLGVDLINNPNLANDPKMAVRIAAWYWQFGQPVKANNAMNFSDIDSPNNFRKVTEAINGGTKGFEDRLMKYELAKKALGVK